ncbi:MAG: CDP-glucose 4,6-dehydratase [Chitinophagaceae bacterium]
MFPFLQEIYGGKRVFLTGHTGFKGSWLLKVLHLLGAEVKGYALDPENEFDLYHLIKGNEICNSVIHDLRNKERLSAEVRSFRPDFIFHMAAQPLVRLSYDLPTETFEVNTLGTAYLLDAVRHLANPCTVVLITTDKVYHNREWVYPYRENDRLGGYDPYSASKACAELIIDSYHKSFFNTARYAEHKKGIAVGRAGNVIGGGDWNKDRLLPDIVRALNNGKKILLRNPGAVRPWQHVLDPLSGYLLLGAKVFKDPEHYSGAYNFGPYAEDVLTVVNLVQLAMEKWQGGAYEIIQSVNQPHEAGLLKLDINKTMQELKWKPAMNAAQAITLTIDWYKQYYSFAEKGMDLFTEEQIRIYFENLKM